MAEKGGKRENWGSAMVVGGIDAPDSKAYTYDSKDTLHLMKLQLPQPMLHKATRNLMQRTKQMQM